MKHHFIYFLSLCILFTFSACQKERESESNSNQEETKSNRSEENLENAAQAEKPEEDKPKSEENAPYLEISIKGGVLDGKTLKCQLRYSSEDQATIEDSPNTTMEFARAVDETGLQVDFDYTWQGDFSEGDKPLVEGSITVHNADKNTEYDFERLVIDFKEAQMKVTSVDDWTERASNSLSLFEGEGSVSQTEVSKFTSQFDKAPAENVSLTYQYRAKAIKY